ncbi:hypothetical protein [Acetobacter fallax]|uniref:Uncharacterized protein n=1 Tax=Acetobacter fallax TaxID=1737473 RepID=A0ABX0K8K1_9PROT|nr:hypothetical protein [Acetobacter fallax]NHO32138.1 hypothetical protein [Acetobacter fallax]NHO35591.1 hypothetical protein [Acetobacter fallax]
MNKSFRSLIAIPVLAGLLAGGTVLPATAGAHGYDMRGGGPRWGGPPPGPQWRRGPGWGGAGWRGPGWGRGAVVGGILGGLAVGAMGGVAMARVAPPPPMAYGPPPPPPVYAVPAPYPMATPYPVYSPYASW